MHNINLEFLPCAKRASALDNRMRVELAHSLQQVVAHIHQQWPDSTTATLGQRILDTLPDLVNKPRQRISPAFFAHYYRVVLAVIEQDNIDTALQALLDAASYSNELCFRKFHRDDFGSDNDLQVYSAALDTDPHFNFELLSPGEEENSRTKSCIQRALIQMQAIAPELAQEFHAMIHEVILVATPKAATMRFDGGSSYMLWGALALSVDDIKSDLTMLETLAHEAGHSFLFGLTIHEPLVNNDDSILYPSPLRPDPRPMDGIYHATFVSARMHYAMQKAKHSGLLNTAEMQECASHLAASRKAFFDGYQVVEQHADLTQTGAEILNNALEYMRHSAD